MEDEDRRSCLLHVVDRTPLQEELPIVPESFPGMDEKRFVRDVGRAGLGNVIANAHEHDAGRESVRVFGRQPCRCVSAVGTAGDTHPITIDQTRRDEMIHGVDQIVELSAPIVSLPQLAKRDPTTCAAAIVGDEDGESPGGGDLAG